MTAQTLIRQASDAGVELRLINGKVKASGLADAVALIVDQLRANKAQLVEFLQAANEIEPPKNPGAWRELARAYHLHHFECATCQAAGRGTSYGLRCGVGTALWTTYQNRFTKIF